jgi:steroid 5-alpha reductase family enzyme
MLLQIVVGVLVAMLVVMVAAWAFGLAVKNGGWTDVFWSFGTGLLLAGAAFVATGADTSQARRFLIAAFMLVWGLRLGLYLALRVAGHPEDARYANVRKTARNYPLTMLWVSLPQAPATALLALTVVAAAQRPEPSLDLRDALAALVFLVAIAGETVADAQMKRFRADPANKGKVIETGLWAWSRHPNYFFEWLGWTAYAVMALDPLHLPTYPTLIAPAVMYLVLRYATGVAPLERTMIASRGEAYRRYQDRVSAFFPLPPKPPSAKTGAVT